MRRIRRRMEAASLEDPDDYLRFLRDIPEEACALFQDILINVTGFFRDAEVFATIEQEAIPRLFARKPAGSTIRVWICGCSTGEEACSIAILILEQMEKMKQTFQIQIFATDVDKQAVDTASAGVYPAGIETDVSPERLLRFFSKSAEDGTYRLRDSVRDTLVFSVHDVIKNPPLSRIDLITCRNVLIYLNAELQNRIIPLFHRALRPDGLLILGTSENVIEFPTLFSALDNRSRIFLRRSDDSSSLPLQVDGSWPAPPVVSTPPQLTRAGILPEEKTVAVHPAAERYAGITAHALDIRARDEQLQTTIEELETSREELRTANEEMQSINEELQTANEDLETSREEMHSINEELMTVNTELQNKVTDLTMNGSAS